jgi:hypothetical protein
MSFSSDKFFWGIAHNFLSLAPVAVFDTDVNKYTEKVERKNVNRKKKRYSLMFSEKPKLSNSVKPVLTVVFLYIK